MNNTNFDGDEYTSGSNSSSSGHYIDNKRILKDNEQSWNNSHLEKMLERSQVKRKDSKERKLIKMMIKRNSTRNSCGFVNLNSPNINKFYRNSECHKRNSGFSDKFMGNLKRNSNRFFPHDFPHDVFNEEKIFDKKDHDIIIIDPTNVNNNENHNKNYSKADTLGLNQSKIQFLSPIQNNNSPLILKKLNVINETDSEMFNSYMTNPLLLKHHDANHNTIPNTASPNISTKIAYNNQSTMQVPTTTPDSNIMALPIDYSLQNIQKQITETKSSQVIRTNDVNQLAVETTASPHKNFVSKSSKFNVNHSGNANKNKVTMSNANSHIYKSCRQNIKGSLLAPGIGMDGKKD